MIQDTIHKLEARLEKSAAMPAETREELLTLLATLKSEVDQLSQTDAEHAESIAGFTALYAHEATRGQRNPALLEHSQRGLASAVSELEQTHPRLVRLVNSICTSLANLGI